MHEIAVNVIVHYKASASVVFLCLYIMVLGADYMEASYPAKRVENCI